MYKTLAKGLLDQTQAAEACGIDRKRWNRWLARGRIPEPTVTVPGRRRKFYRQSDVPQLKAAIEANRARLRRLFDGWLD